MEETVEIKNGGKRGEKNGGNWGIKTKRKWEKN